MGKPPPKIPENQEFIRANRTMLAASDHAERFIDSINRRYTTAP